jgi:photosystem II stability/assembly factor-like uncharacterized protein
VLAKDVLMSRTLAPLLSLLAPALMTGVAGCNGAEDPAVEASSMSASVSAFVEFPYELPAHARELLSSAVQDVAYDDSSGRLYVLHPDGLSISDDRGASFRHVSGRRLAGGNRPLTAIHLGTGVIYVEDSDYHYFVSEDDGATWTQRNTWYDSRLLASGSELYVLFGYGHDLTGIRVSHDHGLTWGWLPSAVPTGGGSEACIDGDIIALPMGRVVRYSTDRGASWRELAASGYLSYVQCAIANGNIYVHHAGDQIRRDMRFDVIRTAEPNPLLRSLSNPFPGETRRTSYGRLVAHGDSVAFVDTIWGNLAAVSRDRGASWEQLELPGDGETPPRWRSLALSDDRVWLGAPEGRGLDIVTADDWRLARASHPFDGNRHFNVYAHDRSYYAWDARDIFRSDDGGTTWTRLAPPWTASAATSTGVAYERGSTLLIGGGDWASGFKVFVSQDRGGSWAAPFDVPGPVQKIVAYGDDLLVVAGWKGSLGLYSYAVDHIWQAIPVDADLVDVAVDGPRLYALYPASMQQRERGGSAWVDAPLPAAPTNHQFLEGPALAFEGERAVFFGDGQFWASTDHGATWARAGRHAGARGAQSLSFSAHDLIHGDGSYGFAASADLGAEWTPISTAPLRMYPSQVLITGDGLCLVDAQGLACAERR